MQDKSGWLCAISNEFSVNTLYTCDFGDAQSEEENVKMKRKRKKKQQKMARNLSNSNRSLNRLKPFGEF